MIRILPALCLTLCCGAVRADDFWPKDAKVYFIEPANGAVVASPVTVKFGLTGLGVAPAGVVNSKTGHHHILVDTAPPAGDALTASLPMDDNHRHFGGGQTETKLKLAPGHHTLQLLVGDAAHVPHDPPLLSEKIDIDVK